MSLVLQLLLTGRVLRTRRRRPGALHRADRDVDGIDGRAAARHAGRRRGAEGQRSGAALFDRQGHGRTAVSAGARRRTRSASSRSSIPWSIGSAMPPAAWWCCCLRRCSAGRRCRCRSIGDRVRGDVDGGGVRGAAAVRREPAREHPPASRRLRARVDAGDGSRHHAADHVAAEGHAEGDRATRSACSSSRTIARCIRPCAGCCITRMPAIRQQAIRLLARAGDATVKDEVEQLVKDPDLGVRTEALLYLTEFDHDRSAAAHRSARRLRGLLDPGRGGRVPGPARHDRRTSTRRSCCCRRWSKSRARTGRRARLEAARLLAVLPDTFDRELRALRGR